MTDTEHREPLTFLTPFFVEHELNGRTYRFYPASALVAFEARAVIRPLVVGITTLNSPVNAFTRSSVENVEDQKNGGKIRREQAEPTATSLEAFKHLLTHRTTVVGNLVDLLTDKAHIDLLARLVHDSLRDECPRAKPSDAWMTQFRQLDVPTLVEFVKALFEANARVFGPFGRKKISEVVDGLTRAPLEPQLPPLPEMPGNSSKMPSSSSPVAASAAATR